MTRDYFDCVRAEFTRLRKWSACWIILAVAVVLNLVFTYLFTFLEYRTGSSPRSSTGQPRAALMQLMLPPAVPQVFTQGMAMFAGVLMLVLGALAVGSGYGWGTWKTAFTRGPSRVTVLAGTLTVLAGIVAALVLVLYVVDTGVAAVIGAVEHEHLGLPSPGRALLGLVVAMAILGMWMLAGAAIGALARGPALAVGLGLVWVLVVENLLRGVAAVFAPIRPIIDHLPGTAAGSLAGSMRVLGGESVPGVLDTLSRPAAFLTIAVYLAVFTLGTLTLVRTRDLV
ncbi:ABC transporter permease subunit [Nocardia sp. BMG111209]|uniref:ABC transporter permease subunit n=1 Tax=Nocardia sp. BMG111209 TaxID=1160137 RepID=UPI00035F5C0B|nr:ABC transporter permease subunit [Nocardia sp. BMG111209]